MRRASVPWIRLELAVVGCAAVLLGPATAAPTPAPRGGIEGVQIRIGSAIGGPGDTVQVSVELDALDAVVAATGNDITFASQALSIDPAACRVNPAIRKTLNASIVRADATSTTVRVLVQSTQNTDTIPDGTLYTCALRIAPSALPGTYRLANELALAVTPQGTTIPGVVAADGAVTVSLIGRACAGDCNVDGSITIDELVLGVNIALGNRPVDDCPAFDGNSDGLVTINELITAVGAAVSGCVAPPTPVPSATPTPTPLPVRLFVRVGGSDASSGLDPANAFATISKAARAAMSGYQIVVGPGTYAEGVTSSSSGAAPQRLMFVADVSGELTGDLPGPVTIDATGTPTAAGFKFSNSSGGVIDGFTLTGGADGGVVIKGGSSDYTIRNCIIFNNPGAGIRVQDSARVVIFNNLIYANGAQGVGIVGQITGSPAARIFSNTIAGNGDRGITIGTSMAASDGALVRNNILQGNGTRTTPPLENIKVFTTPRSDVGYDEDFNLIFPPTYLPMRLAGAHDIAADPAFAFAGGGDFHLRTQSPAINAGDALPLELERVLLGRTTTGSDLDTGALDLGFHYRP